MTEYLRVCARGWRHVVAAVLLGAGVAVALTYVLPQRYESQSTLYLTAPGATADVGAAYDGAQLTMQTATFLLPLLEGPEFDSALAAELGIADPATVEDAVIAGVEPETPVLRITATGGTPADAERLVTAASTVTLELIDRLELAGKPQPTVLARVTGEPSPGTPASPGTVLVIGLGVIVGLIAGCLLALVRDAFDRSVRDEAELAQLVGRPILATIARDPYYARRPLIAGDEIDTVRAEAFRALRSALGFLPGQSRRAVLAVVGPVSREGRTSVLCNLAVAFARSGRSVLVVGSDMRVPGIDPLLGFGGKTGLTTVLEARAVPFPAIRRWAAGPYDVLPTGPLPSNPSELLGSPQMGVLITALRSRYDVVLLDTPPLLSVTDAVVTAAHADGVVFVVARGRSTRNDIEHSTELLRRAGTPISEVVLSGADRPTFRPVVAPEQRIDDPTAVLPCTDQPDPYARAWPSGGHPVGLVRPLASPLPVDDPAAPEEPRAPAEPLAAEDAREAITVPEHNGVPRGRDDHAGRP